MSALGRLRRRLAGAGGYSLVEMVTVMAIMGIVMSGLTTLFVQGSNAEIDMNFRFQAQQQARLALDRMRRDVHCASTAINTSATVVKLNDPCIAGGLLLWCTQTVNGVIGLYRATGASITCATNGRLFIDDLVSANVFTWQGSSTNNLAQVYAKISVNTAPATRTVDIYTLCDGIVLRNSTRTGAAALVASPC